jgi:TNF receptor-associated protein 1
MEVNPNHEIIRKLNEMRKTDMKIAALVARQILDNTMLSAGMVNDVKSVVTRVNKLILHVFDSHKGQNKNL